MNRQFNIGDLVQVTRDGVKQNWKVRIVGYARNNSYVLEFIDNQTVFQVMESELSNV